MGWLSDLLRGTKPATGYGMPSGSTEVRPAAAVVKPRAALIKPESVLSGPLDTAMGSINERSGNGAHERQGCPASSPNSPIGTLAATLRDAAAGVPDEPSKTLFSPRGSELVSLRLLAKLFPPKGKDDERTRVLIDGRQELFVLSRPPMPHAELRISGKSYPYLHRIGDKVDWDVIRSISSHGLRSSSATGVFAVREGVFAATFDGTLDKATPFDAGVFVIFDARHPCVVGNHMTPKTAFFPLPVSATAPEFVAITAPRFVRAAPDGTYTLLAPESASESPLAIDAHKRPLFP
jgi:hypothetical protein